MLNWGMRPYSYIYYESYHQRIQESPPKGAAQLSEDIVLGTRTGYQFGDYRRDLFRADLRYVFPRVG